MKTNNPSKTTGIKFSKKRILLPAEEKEKYVYTHLYFEVSKRYQ